MILWNLRFFEFALRCFKKNVYICWYKLNFNSMIVKQVSFEDKARQDLIDGINTLADAVKSTLGARGKTVLIESENHTHGITVTKDGVTVAKSINLMHPTQNLAVTMMKEAAENTAVSAGDGTTTAIVITQAIVLEAQKRIKDHMNLTDIIRSIQDSSKYVVKELGKAAKKVNGKRLLDVATISSNNDKTLGKIIADAYDAVGENGVVTVENASGTETYSEVIKGMKIDRGYTSKYFITDVKKGECVLDNPYVLVADQEINHTSSIEHILAPIIQEGKPLLIIGTLSPAALNTLNLNKAKGVIKVCSIIPPQFGYKSHDLMSDIAVATGATYYSEDTGDNLETIQMADLGRAKKAIVGRAGTILIKDDTHNIHVENRINDLWEEYNASDNIQEQEFIKERIAIMSGGVAVIHVGAGSDIEQKEKRDRVDDAVCATRAAIEEGILPGGGVALLKIADDLAQRGDGESSRVGNAILSEAMKSPFKQILDNAGINPSEIEPNLDPGVGYDVKGERYGDMIKLGIIDPLKVTKNALENAVSVATTIMSTNAIITNVRDYEGSR